jgi:hypothetical protein
MARRMDGGCADWGWNFIHGPLRCGSSRVTGAPDDGNSDAAAQWTGSLAAGLVLSGLVLYISFPRQLDRVECVLARDYRHVPEDGVAR